MDEQQTQKPTSGGDWSIYGVLGIFLIAAYYVLRVVQRRTAAIPNRTSQSTSDEWDPLAAGSSITFVYENKFRDDYDNMNTEGTPVNLLAPGTLQLI